MTVPALAWCMTMFLVGAAATGNGILTWKGVELPAVERYERTVGPWPRRAGSRRKYQTLWGAGYLGTAAGLGIVVAAVGDLARMIVGEGRAWPAIQATFATGGGLVAVSCVLGVTYLARGLPDRCRPPCQRGWEVVSGHRALLRPGDSVRQRRERRPITPDDGNHRPTSPAWH